MKKSILFLVSFMCAAFLFSTVAAEKPNKVKDEEDRIAFSREGGTTRIATTIIAEGLSDGNIMTVNVQNYRGGVWVEIVSGRGGVVESYFDVYDMGFGVVNISYLRAGTYYVRLLFDNGDVYVGTLVKSTYGR